MIKKYFENILPPKTRSLVNSFQQATPSFLKDFYLTGGTALSLMLGHRESEDLDFFCKSSFNPSKIESQLKFFGRLKNTELGKDTINTFVQGVKLQFLGYPYKLIKPLNNWKGISISSVIDIACTKMQTIGMRGNKKDFIDLYFLLQIFSLDELFEAVKRKYSDVEYNKPHILKSLIYFNDAEEQPMPRMHKNVGWGEVKKRLTEEVKRYSF